MVEKMSDSKKIAVVLVRGLVNINCDIRKTLEYLRLKQKHVCVVLDNTPENQGMVKRAKDYVTFGLIDESFFKEMLDKRIQMVGKSTKKVDTAKLAKEYFSGKLKLRDFEATNEVKPFFRLHPPIGGFERKGIKMPFSKGGVLGDREDKINVLIGKML